MASKTSKKRRKKRRAAAQGAPVGQAGNDGGAGPGEGGGAPRGAEGDAAERKALAATKPSRQQRQAKPRARKRRGSIDDEAPPAPWGSFPLVELCVLVGIVMLILGFAVVSSDRAPVLIVVGLALCSIAGLELAIREHFAGYRSHTLLLAGTPAAIVLGVLFYAGPDALPSLVRAAIAAAVFAGGAILMTRVFRERSGGYAFRFSGLRRR